MTATLEAADVQPVAVRSRRRIFGVAVLVVVLALAGAAVLVTRSSRDAHIAPLRTGGGYEWAAPDRSHTRFVTAGPETALVVAARPGHAQTFYVELFNPTSVAQTVLGEQHSNGPTGEPREIAVALPRATTLADQDEPSHQRFSTTPVTIGPKDVRWLRYTVHTAGHGVWTRGRSESWTDLYLRVRVDGSTRNERIHLQDSAFELRGV